jgi:hypothetical protein
VSYVVSRLQQSILACCGEIRHVRQVIEYTPLRTEVPKPVHPYLRALLVVAVSEHQKTTLPVVVLLKATSEEGIKSLYDLLSSRLHRVLSVELCVLFYDSSEQHDASSVWLRDDGADVIEQRVPSGLLNTAPKA